MFHLIHTYPELRLVNEDNVGSSTRARDGLILKTDIPRSTKAQNSLLFHGAQLWNNLPIDLRNITEFVDFKYTVHRYIDVH